MDAATGGWLALVGLVLGVLAEAVRRRWAQNDRRRENDDAELRALDATIASMERAIRKAFSDHDLGGVDHLRRRLQELQAERARVLNDRGRAGR